MARQLWLAAGLPTLVLLAISPIALAAADCTYRKDSIGNTRYQCQNGRSGTLRTDSLGTLRASDGTVCRSDSLGSQARCLELGECVVFLGEIAN